jgi:hypothetical protein
MEAHMARPEVTGQKIGIDAIGDVDAYSIDEFCRRHGISPKTLYKHPELMPECFFVGTRRLITRESAARWRRQRELEAAATV